MIEGEFEDAIRAKAVGFSHGHFGRVVQTFDDAAGEQFLSAEVVKDQFSMLAERAGDLFHRLYAGPHGLAAPLVEEFAGPSR